jgi:hypothetical protein
LAPLVKKGQEDVKVNLATLVKVDFLVPWENLVFLDLKELGGLLENKDLQVKREVRVNLVQLVKVV